MVDCCTWRHSFENCRTRPLFLYENTPSTICHPGSLFLYMQIIKLLLVHQNYLLQIQVLRSIINLKLINPCNVSSVVYTPLPDWFQSLVYAHNFGGNIGHNLFFHQYFSLYLCVIFILLYAHNCGGNLGPNLFFYQYFSLYLCVIFILSYAHNFGGNSGHNLFICQFFFIYIFGWFSFCCMHTILVETVGTIYS